MPAQSSDSLKTRRSLTVDGIEYDYFSLPAAAEAGLGDISRLPGSLKVLLENLLRHEDGRSVTKDDIRAVGDWMKDKRSSREIAFKAGRVLLQDSTGVPILADLAAMRDAMVDFSEDSRAINPLVTTDMIIDHSVIVDEYGSPKAYVENLRRELQRHRERYSFLRWSQSAFDNLRLVPPGTGICHQVNLEYLARTVWTEETEDGRMLAYPDTVLGADSHTTMVNALGVLGWGVGGIEAGAAMLGQPMSMRLPEVVGVRFHGKMREGATATDLVLTVVQMLREHGVIGKFVEYCGPGLEALSLPYRSTISNMCPEYGATCGFFPIDRETLAYLELTGRDAHQLALVEAYARAQGLWREPGDPDPEFTQLLELDLGSVETSVSGPRRPQDRVPLSKVADGFREALPTFGKSKGKVKAPGADYTVEDGSVVIAAITSCTNTSNPHVIIGAGLLAKKAVEKGLTTKPWIKTSMALGSQVMTDHLEEAGLQGYLDQLGFNLVAYGCTTCNGGSGDLPDPVARSIDEGDLVACAVLSSNRNFEGRVHIQVKANYIASPALVVAYALVGDMKVDLATEALGTDKDGKPVYLKDIWPTDAEIEDLIRAKVTPYTYRRRYAKVFDGGEDWQAIKAPEGVTYAWDPKSTYIAKPPYFEGMSREVDPSAVSDVRGARPLVILGDFISTDHISPVGMFTKDDPAGRYLMEKGLSPADFNSYGSRRGNHHVMVRGTFGNVRLKNLMVPGSTGGVTVHMPSGEKMSVYDAAVRYQEEGVPLVAIGGRNYGTGSSRDWAAKGPALLGMKAVIAQDIERIHRSNLIGMGILPLTFEEGQNAETLGLDGTETYDITGLDRGVTPRMPVRCTITRKDGSTQEIALTCAIETEVEADYFRHGGIMQYVLRRIVEETAKSPKAMA